MEKVETIYNFRIEVEGEYYNPQYNHPTKGWVYLKTNTVTEDEKGNYNDLNVYVDTNGFNDSIIVYAKNFAIAIIEQYKKVNGLENIQREYFYIE